MQTLLKYLIKFLRNLAVGDYRSKKLSNLIFNIISKYNKKKNNKNFRFWFRSPTKINLFLEEKTYLKI